jgi:hypothetical protein
MHSLTSNAGIVKHFNVDNPDDVTTVAGLEHQMRPLKKKALAMQAGTACKLSQSLRLPFSSDLLEAAVEFPFC